ncbi:pyridoxal phosphate-dependent aminotransferase [Algisphaera agarilytica]|uniref:Aminotransferase n=1 Tax=Algisphaera agarilytica TaxID=1385975 RepID=A0A7X0HAB6_9BACT|nr:aminotransferase class I/II-fold pyridoxal phosphate-dependent enzyme [Algisphaera agarilytica]MBB6431061.1 aspartate/methionine/tyrosine aminotransferase [Algisphaera agarilytica]
MLNPDRFITDRLRAIDASGIRRVFDLAAQLEDPINLSIGQPDFDVPEPIKKAAADAIDQGFNRYTQTQGIADLRAKLTADLSAEFPETLGQALTSGDASLLITSGVSGGLMLAMMTCVGPGDEVLIPDPYFVMYKHLVTLAGATPVFVDTYPDFQVTPERLAEKVTERTKLVLFNTPSNPTGVMATAEICEAVTQFCAERELLLLSDEIYDVFQYTSDATMPSPVRSSADALLMRGFSKTYGMTGWRLGYVAGPTPIVEQMTKLQQYSFVCAPSMTQLAGTLALDVDMSEHVAAYARKRDRVVEVLSPHFELAVPGGAFYAFPKVPEHLGLTGTQFVEAAVARNLLIIPGNVFSQHDTHFRLSYACDDATLERGLEILVELAKT